jgi:beta-alanine--pyruvate transaminase
MAAMADDLRPDAPTNALEAFFMPFTANRRFKANPRLLARAEGMHYYTQDGRQVLDAIAGLWCVNLGHCRAEITQAIQKAAATLDFAPTFQMGHPLAFRLAEALADEMPAGLDRIFFTNSGSESVDTALKIALAYHQANGEPRRTRLIGRQRGYHGTNFGGISVGGIQTNRRAFGALLPNVDHLMHTYSREHQAYSHGQPRWGGHLAEELNDLIALHGADTIAAVIVEPLAGSTGVLPPPVGYLEALRAITEKHGIVLIFDEVITGFGRMGATTASEALGVTPDIITLAKGLTNAAVPMGAVAVKREIHDAFMTGPEHLIELFHGYTYSGHPLASAAALASLKLYRDTGVYENARDLALYWQKAVHSLKGKPHVVDIRNWGTIGAIELEPRPGAASLRAQEIHQDCYERGLLIRTTGDIIALSPPLILERSHIDQIVDILGGALGRAR